jgi:hypothetical protein
MQAFGHKKAFKHFDNAFKKVWLMGKLLEAIISQPDASSVERLFYNASRLPMSQKSRDLTFIIAENPKIRHIVFT